MSVIVHQEIAIYQQDVTPIISSNNAIASTTTLTPAKDNSLVKPLIGIIYPPPEVRNIIDRTSEFIARNGLDFEIKIRANEKGNAKFNFLNDADPYNVYYKRRIEEIKDGKLEQIHQIIINPTSNTNASAKNQQVRQLDFLIPKEPPPCAEYLYDPPTISSLDLNIVKLTAMFVAKNGRSFINKLMDKEQKNYQFDFLRPQHSLYSYYNKLVDQYGKILVPTKSSLDQLETNTQSNNYLMKRAERKFHWNKYQRRIKQSEEEMRERERQEYSRIDWHDFVLVETITFDEDSDIYLPPPITRQQLTARLIAQAKHELERDMSEPAAVSTHNDNPDTDEEVEMEHNIECNNSTIATATSTSITNSSSSNNNNNNNNNNNDDDDDDDVDNIVTNSNIHPENISVNDNMIALDLSSPFNDGEVINTISTSNRSDSNSTTITTSKIVTLNRPNEMGHLPKLTTLLPSLELPIKIRADYDPKAISKYIPNLIQSAPPVDSYLTSPITGEIIHKEKASTHVKHLLVDPKWRETQHKMVENAKQQDYVYAEGSQITQNLRDLADRRTDIFGSGGEETLIGKKIDEEKLLDSTDYISLTGSSEIVAQLIQSTTIDNALLALKDSIADTIHAPNHYSTKSLSAPIQSSQSHNNNRSSTSIATTNIAHNTYSELKEEISVNNISSQFLTPLMSKVTPNFTSFSQTPTQFSPRSLALPIRHHSYDSNLPHTQLAMNHHTPLFLQRPSAPPNLSKMIASPNIPISNVRTHSQSLQVPNLYFNHSPNLLFNQMSAHTKPDQGANIIKRVRIDGEEQLIPEEDYLRLHSGSVSFKVYCPTISDKPEWNLTGQILSISLPITDHVSVIKARITTLIGMPVGKQKLQLDNLFIKDSNTLAYYNFDSDSVVQLFIKERGGRRK